MTNAEEYNLHHQKSLEDLSLNLSYSPLNSPDALLMRIVYEQKTMEKQDEYNKQQIELQHKRNTELVIEQVKWVKYSAIITALATIAAALLGWYLGREGQQLKEQLRLKTELLQQIELRTQNTNSEIRPVQIPDKVPPSSPPSK
ncbi:MAG: hypothetical protein PHH91_11870 [Desulfuromonadaceae bacterium]|nr:hypothetical protein [Desulfuromonadaceae bacterium]